MNMLHKDAIADERYLYRRLNALVQPVLQRVSEQIDNYSIEEIQAIATAALGLCTEWALVRKEMGCSNEEVIIDGVVKALAHEHVIKPIEPEIDEIFRILAEQDPRVATYIASTPLRLCYGNRAMKGAFMREHSYQPLEDKMAERLKPFVTGELAPILKPASFGWMSLFNRLWPL